MRIRKAFVYQLLSLLAILCFSFSAVAQQEKPVQVSYEVSRLNDSIAVFSVKVKLGQGIDAFELKKSDVDIIYSDLNFDSSIKSRLQGSAQSSVEPTAVYDSSLEANLHVFTKEFQWQQHLLASPTDSFAVHGSVNIMYKVGEEYIPFTEEFQEYVLPDTSVVKDEGSVSTKSLWWIFLAGFAGGLLALITPCVFSMIPVTVSFFIKRSKTKADGIKNAISYSASIMLIFTLLGFLITVIFGPTALNSLATNWVANFIFFLVFLVFGISFLGAFDISLPSSWSNKVDSKAGTSSYIGIFFMALTLVIVSFSCTGPIIGNLIVIASRGNYYGPLLGMFGFSIALALPFAFFAFFPGKMNMLGKAGGWLNAVKVSLGFLELALALKFLSNADLAMGWRILDREIFIAFWVVIFILLGFYLLGKLKFHHDDELPKNDFGISYISIPRLFIAIASFTFAVYMLPGMWGAPLKGIGAFLPPMGTQDFTSPSTSSHTGTFSTPQKSGDGELPAPKKFYERMHIFEPEVVTKYGMTTYFDYQEALEISRQLKKPLMLDFTGINCVNCRAMEAQVWSDPSVMKLLKEEFVIASLYVDVKTGVDLQPSEQYYSEALGKKITNLGDKNADLQISTFNANTQPYYFFLDGKERRLMPEGYGYDSDITKFKEMLLEVIEKYKATL